MAQLMRKGASCASLYELETSLARVISDLGLSPLSACEEEEIRSKLGSIIGRGLNKIEATRKLNPEGKLQTKTIAAQLRAITRDFQFHEGVLRGRQTGMRQAHEIEVASRLVEALSKNGKIRIDADQFLDDFCDRLTIIADASMVAADALELNKVARGNKAIDWFDDFTRVLVSVAEKNGIRPKIENDRKTRKPKGRFFELATEFERLLYPKMRSPSPSALAKRLSRSLARRGQNRSSSGQIMSM